MLSPLWLSDENMFEGIKYKKIPVAYMPIGLWVGTNTLLM